MADALVGPHPVDQVAQQQLGVIPFSHVMQVQQVAAQHFGSLDQVDVIAAVGDRQRCSHPGYAAADNQRAGTAAMFIFVDWLRYRNPPDRHAHQFLGFAVGDALLPLVHPAALLAQVDQFHQIGIQSCLAIARWKSESWVRLLQAAITTRLSSFPGLHPGLLLCPSGKQAVSITLHVYDVLAIGLLALTSNCMSMVSRAI